MTTSRCARCRRCQNRVSSGTDLTKEGLCTSCHSMRKCPKCSKLYQLGDKIIRCSACLRWYHGTCEDLYNDEMLENASQNKMRCSNCRPSARNYGGNLSMGFGGFILRFSGVRSSRFRRTREFGNLWQCGLEQTGRRGPTVKIHAQPL